MNFSNFRFTLDLHSLHSQTSIPVMLGDTGITWHINLCDGGKPYLIAEGCLAKISIKRPTGTYHEAFCEIRENATIVYPFEQETCVAVGLHNCEITLYGVDGTVLGTPRFSMVVGDRVIRNDDINLTDQDRTIVDAMAVEEAKRQAAEESRAARFEQTIEDMKETFRNSAVHIGPEAPENGETIWLDTNEEEKSEIGVVAKVGQVLAVKSIGADGKPAEYYGVDLPKVPTPNMDANEGEEGYVEGRTHYVDKNGVVHKLDNKYINAAWMATKEEKGGTIEWWQDLAFTSAYFFLNQHWYPDVGFDWDIYWNNTKYTCPLVTSAGECFLGNRSLLGSEYPDTGEPFLFYGYALTNKDPEIVAVKKKTETAETVNVVITTKHEIVYNTLPKEYLPPDMENGTGVDSHNVNAEAHNDIRLLIAGLNTRLNTLANSEDVNLDQLAELVAYIKSNRTLIEQVTTNKVNVTDIINNLTSSVETKPLSAAQGVALKALIDAIKVPTKLSELTADSTHRTVTDSEKTLWNGMEAAGTAAGLIGTHNASADAHNDIRALITGLTTRLNALANSTDVDLDQLAELVAYIKANRGLIEQITTNKVNVADIVNNLSSNVPNKPLSAAQGAVLKGLIDAITVPTKLSELSGDSTHRTVTDSEKSEWSGKENAGVAAGLVIAHNVGGDAHNDIRLLIEGLNTRLNAVANSSDVNLDQLAELVAYIKANRSLVEQVTTNKVNVADIINNLTSNVDNKPLSAAQGVALKALIDAITVPTKLSELGEDSFHRTVTDEEKEKWNVLEEVERYTATAAIVIPQQSVSGGMWMNRKMDISPGIVYAVYINGKVYFCTAHNHDGGIYLGNITIMDSSATDPHNNEPFCVYWAGGSATGGFFYKDSALGNSVTLKVTGAEVTTENKLPKKYLPDDVAMKSDIPEGGGGGGSASIDVTASVGQTIVVEEVDADGKPTKWKSADYQKKICGSELGYIIPETTINFDNGDSLEFLVDTLLVDGETYVVTWQGVDYTCVCVEITADGMTLQTIGNALMIGGEDTGEPFFIGTTLAEGNKVCMSAPVDETVTSFTFSVKGKKYVPIPVQYVTNALPYYIDLDSEFDQYGRLVTASCKETAGEITALDMAGRTMIARARMRDDANGYTKEIFYHYCGAFRYDDGRVAFGFLSMSEHNSLHPSLVLIPNDDGTCTITIM